MGLDKVWLLLACCFLITQLVGCSSQASGSPAETPEKLPPLVAKPYTIGMAPSHIIEVSPDALFEPGAKWQRLASQIDYYKYYSLQGYNAPSWCRKLTLPLFVPFMKQHKIAIGAEFGGFGGHRGIREGTQAARAALAVHQGIYDAGGTLASLHLDGPIRRMLKGAHGGNDCQLDLAQSAREVATFYHVFHQVHPETEIGLITNFPNWDYTPDMPGMVGGFTRHSGVTYAEALEATYQAVSKLGEHIAFVEIDCPFLYYRATHVNNGTARVDNRAKFLTLQKWCESRHIKLYIIINQDVNPVPEAKRDQAFYAGVLDYIKRLRQDGVFPDSFLIQSWYHGPARNLPEDQPYTFTFTVRHAIELIKTLFPAR